MWGRLVDEVRKAGPRKVLVFTIAAAIAVILAYGVNSTNEAANGHTLPRLSHQATLNSHVPATAAANRPR